MINYFDMPSNLAEEVAEVEVQDSVLEKGSDENEVLAWCPGGSASGGVCKPFNNERATWMRRYSSTQRSVASLPVGEAILPGTHNSGFDKRASHAPTNQTCQDVPIYDQLMAGIRVLDLRVQFFSGNTDARRFSIFHLGTNGRTVETDVLDALLRYRSNAGAYNEIVILNFHEFKNFTDAGHRELAQLIHRKLGDQLIPKSCMPVAIRQLWELGKNTVIAYHKDTSEPFWKGVDQKWIGSNTPSKNQLAEFIIKIGNESKEFGKLRSIQAAYYSLPGFVPKDISGELMQWFAAGNSKHPIQRHYIINTDWSLRQRLVDNIIFGNGVRAEERGAHVIVSSPNTAGSTVQTRSYGIFQMADANWSANLSFGANDSSSESIQVISSDASYNSELTLAQGGKLTIKRGDRLVFRVPSRGAPVLIERFGI